MASGTKALEGPLQSDMSDVVANDTQGVRDATFAGEIPPEPPSAQSSAVVSRKGKRTRRPFLPCRGLAAASASQCRAVHFVAAF